MGQCIVVRMTSFIAGISVALGAVPSLAQQYPPVGDRQYPLNQMSPPGTHAQWAINAGRVTLNYSQPIRITLPAEGNVTFYESWGRHVSLSAPAQAGLTVGRMYRMKIDGMADFPGMEFYPSIELIDRLHPPTGREEDFPVEVPFTTEEFEWAASGRLITKVVYLEQPDRVPTALLEQSPRIITIEPSRNALAEADALGRPVAIVRLGGRTPDPSRPEPDFFGPGGPVRTTRKGAEASARRAAANTAKLAQNADHRPDAENPGAVNPGAAKSGAVQQVSHSQPADINCPPFSTPCPPDPRWMAPAANPFAPGMIGCQCETTWLSEKFPDEYLCDGGDRELPVHYGAYTREGLDTEDTVAEYTDHRGKERVRASNRVCLYAPRLSIMRTISRPHEDLNLAEVARVGQSVGSDQMHTRLMPKHKVKNEMSGRMLVRSRASGLESDQLQGNVSSIRSLIVHEKLLNTYQDLTFVRSGKLEKTDSAQLNFGIQASLFWSRELYPIISAKTDQAMTGTNEAHVATIVGIDDKKSDDPGKLRLVKLADKQTAQSGDVVEFTIRYDNMGPNTVHHVRIVDNLTPRLAYVDDSATSDRDGRLVVQDNGEGSLVLVWELTNPLPPKTGGVVSFKARIR